MECHASKVPEAPGGEGDVAALAQQVALLAVATTDDDDAATDSGGEEDDDGGMTCLEYITAYRQLPPFEVELLLESPVQRARHEARQDMRVRFQEWVRSEYEAYGCVAVSDEYVARRTRIEEISDKLWEEAFADFGEEGDEDDESGQQVECAN